MNDLNYASNSEGSKNRQPKQKVVSGTVTPKQMTRAGKLASIFIAEDVSNVKEYVWTSVIVPMCKKGMTDLVATGCDLITNAFSMLVNGTPASMPGRRTVVGGRQAYDKCFVQPRSATPETAAPTRRAPEKDFVFPERADAESVLNQMLADINEYGSVTMDDLYDYIGITPDGNWQMSSIGWSDLSQAYIEKVRGGWMLALPRVKALRGS